MGAFYSATPRLLRFCIFAACFLFLFANVGYQVSAESEVDSDLVFDNIEESRKNSHDNTITRRDTSKFESQSSHPSDQEHWLSSTVHRIKRQLSSLFNFHNSRANGTEQEQDDYGDFGNGTDSAEEDGDRGYLASDAAAHRSVHQQDFSRRDDEDEEETSGDNRIEGSGTTAPQTSAPNTPVFYRIFLTVMEPYLPAFQDKSSKEYQTLSRELIRSINELYELHNQQVVAHFVKVEPRDADSFSSKVTIDLGTNSGYDREDIKEVLYSQTQSRHSLGTVQVSTDDFVFREFSAPVAPTQCEGDQMPCRGGQILCVPIDARCNGKYECDDKSDEAGCEDILPTPYIPVSVNSGFSAFPTEASFFTTIQPDLFNVGEPDEGDASTPLTSTPKITTHPTTLSGPIDRCRADDKVRCHLSSVYICEDQTCDGHPDCPNGEDEVGCPSACATGEIGCDLTRCIPASKRCDGESDCADGTDEDACDHCRSGSFRCDNGTCIRESLRCDGHNDCQFGEDEQNCPDRQRCNNEEIACGNGKCIPAIEKCDGKYDCDDHSDERFCPCKTNEFTCTNGFCIPPSQHCDGTKNCQDGSDERGCPTSPICRYYQRQCKDGTCIDKMLWCNKRFDCADKSDEEDCVDCKHDEFRCNNGSCLSIAKRCDGVSDCQHSEDEESCALCGDQEYRCKNGDCVNAEKRCNGNYDCSDRSDEVDCNGKPELVCIPNAWMCLDKHKCIRIDRRCNGLRDCQDGSDEKNCPAPDNIKGEPENTCEESQFQCAAGYCIMGYKRCNGITDCPSGNDEANCPTPSLVTDSTCGINEFRCNSGTCIDTALRCDGVKDCTDGSDEQFCHLIPTDEPCEDNKVRCYEGECVEGAQCDGIFDCIDGSDEYHCKLCAPNQFRCSNGDCIEEDRRCNGIHDCSDSSDESECVKHCNLDQFRCGNGLCLDIRRRCDGVPDCEDHSDEHNCTISTPAPSSCTADQFRCRNGVCLNSGYRCDGFPDCSDKSDEENCAVQCKDDEFDCEDSGICIPQSKVCDQRTDCPNNSDEEDCNVTPPPPKLCGANEFPCLDGSCVPNYFYCDGHRQCRDGSDEADCGGCRNDQFTCANGACIPSYLRCSGQPECTDHSDEANCPTQAPPVIPEVPLTTARPTAPPPFTCPYAQQPCRSGNQCFPFAAFCNGHFDCNDLSDEDNCPNNPRRSCTHGYFRCENGPCIREELRCDGKVDCPYDSSDELDCPEYAHGPYIPPYPGSSDGLNLRTYPSDQTIKESREVVFQCRDEGPLRARVHWARGSGLPLPPGSRDINGRLEIPNVQLDHSGPYICSAVGYPSTTPGSQVQVNLNVERFTTPSPPRPPQACGLQQATCSNGDCIAKNLVCDGNYDCTDGSDETRCNQHGCEPNEFRCANKRCVLKTWRCDSDDDCGDGSDEANCATNPPGSQCSYHQFACNSGNQCIPKSFHCDLERDCVDGSDEVGCSSVTISRSPPPMVTLDIGSLFEISCTAVGIPVPEIVWRLNWGHIPEKCSMKSVNGVGTLTCPNIQEEDQGAYSCEAINIRGSVFAVPDTILVVKPPPTVCPRGYFNEEAKSVGECIPCFCFGSSTECRSADLFTYQLHPPFDSHQFLGVRIDPSSGVVDIRDEPIYRGSQPKLSPVGRFGVRAELASPYGELAQPDVVPYFVMPENYHHNQLKSYGGYLKYKIRYEGFGRPTSSAPAVILIGNGYTLLHAGRQPQSGREENISVRFFVGDWVKRSETSPETLATREEIMMALAAVENILIKLQYVDGHLDTSISDIEMDSAAARNTGQGQAAFVEECKCPVGYTGLSCENCASGYTRHRNGPWLGHCFKEVEKCPPGTYGDPERGIACETCPCPLTNPSNQFARTCSLDSDGEVTCDCPPGYVGRRCQQCAAGYSGNPLIPGDYCKPGTCSSEGALSVVGDSIGRCVCKQNTDGPTCNQCKPNTFYLSADNQFGCIACFCMGITQQCSSSNWYRDQIKSVFTSSRNDFKLVGSARKSVPIEEGIQLNSHSREIVYSDFSSQNSDVYYWSLPVRYLGNKITSYGGNLKYSLRYIPTPGGQSSRNTAPDVELISNNHINLQYFRRDQPLPNTVDSFSVSLFEQNWQRADGQRADREHLLMALANLKAILIKATYTTSSREVGLISVSLDIADERNTGSVERAHAVEQCHCPLGYRGLSCESCDVGYTRATEGLYLGLCEVCQCNGHTNECDAETGECLNCRSHTTGFNCELCLPGYERDSRDGTCKIVSVDDCQCSSSGSTSQSCFQGVCQCKTNVEGNRCDRCRKGTFGLNVTNPEGCQECFCSGVSDECSESSLYVQQIPIQIIDESHGFSLTDQLQRNVITNGFEINLAMNEIGYSFRPSSIERLYWSLPRSFTGNHIKSYGGRLDFTQRYTQRPGARYAPDQDVIISGNGITIYWTSPKESQPEVLNRITLILSPAENWQRLDYRQGPRPASRWDILRVLANVDSVLIRATQSTDTASAFLNDISLDTAIDHYTGQARAANVEMCKCPQGYRGTSCELCDAGFYKDVNDRHNSPLGSCTRCPCSNNEQSCSLEPTGQVVCSCLPGYTGRSCDVNELTPRPTEPPTPTSPPLVPTIIVSISGPKIRIIEIGNNVRMKCSGVSSISPNNPLRIAWLKDGGQLPADAIDDRAGLLILTNLRVSDSGNYICQVSDGISIVTDYVTVNVGGNVPEAPRVAITPDYLQVLEGEPIELHCTSSGNPQPTLQWTRVGHGQFNPRHSFTNGIFRIPNALKSDEAEYECTAINSAGSDTRKTIVYVRDEALATIHPNISPSSYFGKTGDKFSLTCVARGQLHSIAWSRQGDSPLPYSSTSENGVLTVYDAKVEDSGVYVCTVTSYTGKMESESATVRIDASGVSSPTVRVEPERQTVVQGSTIEIHCNAVGSPTPTIKWTKLREQLGPNAQQVGSTLRIHNVQPSDQGVYTCVANNNVGYGEATTIIEVERRETPAIELYPNQSQIVTVGGSAILQCRLIAGIPQPTLKWTRGNNQPLSRNIEELSNGVLRFTQLTLAESGEYVCSAENVAGKITAIAHIEVQTLPLLTITPSTRTVTVNVGERVRFECRATGHPQPTVQWSRILPQAQDRVTSAALDHPLPSTLDVAVYEITSVREGDTGIYKCQGSNNAGASEEYIQLYVDSLPTRGDITNVDAGRDNEIDPRPPVRNLPSAFDEKFTAPVGTRAELRCRIDSNADRLHVEWIRGNNSSLPASSTVRDGTLFIDNVDINDGGEYRCVGVSSSGAIVFNFVTHLEVISPPRIVLRPQKQIVRPGDNARIECVATGEQPINIVWTGINREMPRTVYASGGLLEFRNIQVLDAGVYRCTANNVAGQADAVAEVTVQDYAREPEIKAEGREQNATLGQNVLLHCVVRGDARSSSVHWLREHLPLPVTSRVSGEYLQIPNVQLADSGRYLCQVTSSSGTFTDHINLHINERRHCRQHQWQCDNGQCIDERRICDQRFDCHDRTDEIYCRERRRREHIKEPLKSAELDIQASSPVSFVGDTLTLHCRSNENGVITTWSKHSGRFADNVQTSGGTLRINSITSENAGIYRCEAKGYRGVYYKDHNVEVVDATSDEPPIETKTAPQGSIVVMDCRTSLDPPVSYQWSKQGGALPREIDIHSRSIRVENVRAVDAGTYVCSARNAQTSIDIPTILVVTGIVPHFAQAPVSYIAFPTLPDAYLQFNFEISFRPETPDGLILYNGHKKTPTASDFISLTLVNGVPEFRFNFGYSVSTVKADRSLLLGKWHTVKILRNRKKVTMYVDGDGPFIGVADGRLVGLDLTEPMYIGGVPHFKDIVSTVGVDTGFVGCISRLKIGHAHQDILKDAIVKEGITRCEICTENPCQNQGVCQETLTKEGFTCICPVRYSGPTCSKLGGQSCAPNVCGAGRCIDTENSFECSCPLGRAGNRCEREITVYEPAFSNDAYVAYPAPKPQRRIKASLKFKPKDLKDGILLYCSETEEGHGDFASLAIKDKHLEFRFDAGNGPAIVRSNRELQPGQWLTVSISRSLSDGRLVVNGDAPVVGRSPGNHKALNLQTNLYVGGYDKNTIRVNPSVGVNSGFNGCISEISITGLDLNIIHSATDSANVQDCSSLESNEVSEEDNLVVPSHAVETPQLNPENTVPYVYTNTRQTGCSVYPCQNDGVCYPLSPVDYKCTCVHGFTGRNCEIAPNFCEHANPCQNAGRCQDNSSGYKCNCPLGYTGNNCEHRAEIANEVSFAGDGYLELDKSLLNHDDDEKEEIVALELSTNSSNGLVFWQGQTPNEDGQGRDYVSLAVVDGYLEYSFDLGSGPAIISNNDIRINDGKRHSVVLKRRGESGTMEIDRDNIVKGTSAGITTTMNCDGNIYLGGTPNISLMTGGRYKGFNGCIHGFELGESKILDLGTKAISGINVKPCSSSDAVRYLFDGNDHEIVN